MENLDSADKGPTSEEYRLADAQVLEFGKNRITQKDFLKNIDVRGIDYAMAVELAIRTLQEDLDGGEDPAINGDQVLHNTLEKLNIFVSPYSEDKEDRDEYEEIITELKSKLNSLREAVSKHIRE